jgi:hypothetical protein
MPSNGEYVLSLPVPEMERLLVSATDHPVKRHPRNRTRVSLLLSPLAVRLAVVMAALMYVGTPFNAVVKELLPPDVVMFETKEYL